MTVFEQIKEAVKITELAQRYGFLINRTGYMLCPFHDEKSPSLKLYPNTNTFYCFGCGAGSSVVDLTAAIQRCTPLEAAKQLDIMYSLNLFDKTQDKQKSTLNLYRSTGQAKNDNERINDFYLWEQWACNVIATYLYNLRKWKRDFVPRTRTESLNPFFVEACRRHDYFDYLFENVFITGNYKSKIEFYKSHAQEVEFIANRINEIRKDSIA